MQVAVSIHEVNEWLWENPGAIERTDHIHVLDWGEETRNVTYNFESEPRNRPALRKAVRQGRLTYHSNSATPSVLEGNDWIHTWPDYDLTLSWQIPTARTQEPELLYHSQNRLVRPHRHTLVEQLWKQDRFARGTVSYTQELTAEFKENIILPQGEHPWQPHVLGWLEPYSGYDKDMVIFMENNPPPPLQYWRNAAVNLVAETEWEYPNLTEKTYSCLLWAQPFLLIGAPKVNRLVQDQGFELPEHVFDYTFDKPGKLKKRTRTMVQQVLEHTPVELYRALKPTAQNNQKILINKLANLKVPKILNDDRITWMPMAQRVKDNILKSRQQARDILL